MSYDNAAGQDMTRVAEKTNHLNVAKDTQVEQSEISKCVPWYLPNMQPRYVSPVNMRAHARITAGC